MELSAVIFPDTVLSERICIPLVPVFQPLVYLQPVENDPVSGLAGTTLADDLAAQSLCRTATPAPLGEDRERFLRLVSDIRTRRDDYAAQLGHQTLAGISSAAGKRAESKSSIVGSLLARHGIKEAGEDRRKLLLWQTRLLLKLAEMQAADQEELRREIRRIREKEQALFAGVREESELPFAFTGGLADAGQDRAALRQQRKAWARLLVLGDAVEIPRIFLSEDRDGVDLLVEEYEKRTGKVPVSLGRIALPAAYPEPAGFIEQVRRFREEGAGLQAKLQARLAGAAGADAPGCFTAEEQEGWAGLLERHFPENRCGRTHLSLSACPGRSAPQLFAETFSPEELEFLRSTEPASRVVLGHLEG